jgi:hypothetical protein
MFIITKEWPGVPASRQPATKERYFTYNLAVAVMAELQRTMPDRRFRIIKVVDAMRPMGQ